MGKSIRGSYLRVREAPASSSNLSAQSDLELLAIVMGENGEAIPSADDLQMADQLLDGGSAALLKRLTPRRVRSLTGAVRAARLLAALELGRRAISGNGSRVLSSPKHVQRYAHEYASAEKEHFLVVHLTTRHVPRLLEVVSVGTLNASLVHAQVA